MKKTKSFTIATSDHIHIGYPTELRWELLTHPLYSSNFARLNCHLFRYLQNFRDGVNLVSIIGCKNYFSHNFLLRNHRSSTVMGLSCCQKNRRRSTIKMAYILFHNIVLRHRKSIYFNFGSKTANTFSTVQYNQTDYLSEVEKRGTEYRNRGT